MKSTSDNLCSKCPRCTTRSNIVKPDIHYSGDRPDIFILGESPGTNEDAYGKPFVGEAGNFLRKTLVEVTDEFILDNPVRCFSNIKPTSSQMKECRPNWESVIEKHDPKLIIALGNYAAEILVGKKIKISSYAGHSTKINVGGKTRIVIFGYHPSYIIRNKSKKGGEYEKAVRVWFDTWDLVNNILESGIQKAPKTLRLTRTSEVQKFLKWLDSKYTGTIVYDYETFGDVNALRPELCDEFKILSIGVGIDVEHSNFKYPGISFMFDSMTEMASPAIQHLWSKIIKKSGHVAQNAKYEHKCNLRRFGFTSYLNDTMLAMNTIDELASANLGAIGRYCGISWASYKLEMEESQKNPSNVPAKTLLKYSALEGAMTYIVWFKLLKEIDKLHLDDVLFMRQNFAMHLAYIEMDGIHINPEVTVSVRSKIIEELDDAQRKFKNNSAVRKTERWAINNIKSFKKGNEFNPKSAPQMHHLCLEVLKLKIKPSKFKWKNGQRVSGTVSLDKTVLVKFEDRYPVLKDLARVRSLSSMLSGFLNKYEDFTGPEGCVHTNYTQEVVVTGRLSSTAPNLQNVPLESIVRKVFDSRFDDGWLIAADYAQLEPTLLAGWSGDKAMCEALNNGMDLHRFVATKIYSVKYEDVTDKQRHIAKRRNLGSMYGQTAEGLADATGLSLDEAKHIIAIYDKTFADASKFRITKFKEAQKYGIVKDLFGAMRHLKNAQSSEKMKRERAMRQAGNFPIQSTGNSFHLIAMCILRRYLKERKLKAIVVGVEHDKIYVDSAGICLEEVINTTEEAMLIHNKADYWRDMPVPISVDVKYGRNMLEMKKWDK